MLSPNLSHIIDAISWPALHASLAAHGYTYTPKGGGAVIRDGSGAETKASVIHRKASLKYMVDRLGSYVPAGEVSTAQPEPSPQPIPYARHEIIKSGLQRERNQVVEILLDDSKSYDERRPVLVNLYKAAPESYKPDLAHYIVRCKEKIADGKNINAKISDLEVWERIGCPGYNPASRPLHEDACAELQGFRTKSARISELCVLFREYHNAVNAEWYRITCRKAKDMAFIFDRETDKRTKPEDVRNRFGKMLRFADQGEHVYFTPLSDNVHHILVDDLDAEHLVRMTSIGYHPAIVIESSPGNFQAIINVKKFGTNPERDKEIGNKLSNGINKLFGDINLSGAVHPHRVPGFVNPKLQYRMDNGEYPIVKITSAEGGYCAKMRAFAEYLDSYDHVHKATKTTSSRNERNVTVELSDNHRLHAAIYLAHKINILYCMQLKEESADMSRVDYAVALRLRGTGHSQAEIASILLAGAPTGRENKHDWQDYATRTANAVFSASATRQQAKYSQYLSHWQKIEDKAAAKVTAE